jgi:uncharacterized membrane protein
MKTNAFVTGFKHKHAPIRNVNDIINEKFTFGQRISDSIAKIMGSWYFIIIQSVLISFWIVLNVTAYIYKWDPYPFILLNLFLSLQAAYTAPVIMMSQNRLAEKDRIEAHNDYLINIKSEEEVRAILDNLQFQNEYLLKIMNSLSGEGQNTSMTDKPVES